MKVLFEDADIIVVEKPSGLLTHATVDRSRENLLDNLHDLLRARSEKQNRDRTDIGEIYLQHRLDKDTSGIVLLTKSKAASLAISQQFKDRSLQKVYHALLHKGPLHKNANVIQTAHGEWSFKGYLKADKGKKCMRLVQSGGDFSLTHFKIVNEFKNHDLVQAILETGRTHQIRIHSLLSGKPILNDPIYFDPDRKWGPLKNRHKENSIGSKGDSTSRLMLHASKIIFKHPILGTSVEVESPLPPEFSQD